MYHTPDDLTYLLFRDVTDFSSDGKLQKFQGLSGTVSAKESTNGLHFNW